MAVRDTQGDAYVARYLLRMKEADLEKRDSEAMNRLKLSAADDVMDVGAGEGRLTLKIAPMVRRVTAVDPSVRAIRRVRLAARKLGLVNVTSQVAGFLDFDIKPDTLRCVVSRDYLHHLMDAHKRSAIDRVHTALASGGSFVLHDIIFPFPLTSVAAEIPQILQSCASEYGEEVSNGLHRTLKRQHPTSIDELSRMITKAGFEIESCNTQHGIFTTMICVKQ